jgi:hypothetical protein
MDDLMVDVVEIQGRNVELHIVQVENTVVTLEVADVLQGAVVVMEEHNVELHIADLENIVVTLE